MWCVALCMQRMGVKLRFGAAHVHTVHLGKVRVCCVALCSECVAFRCDLRAKLATDT